MPADHHLDDATLDRIFETTVAPAIFRGATASADPLLILIGAQPGAGKTRAGRDAAANSGQRVIRIIGDDLRPFHPHYRELLEQDPAAMPEATKQASGEWVERAIKHAVENRISVLVEGTFRVPATPLGTAQQFKDAGFTVEVVVVAVAPEISRASTAQRFVEDDSANGAARFTPLSAHDEAFNAIPTTLEGLAAAGSPVDRITVFSRAGQVFAADRPLDGGVIPRILDAVRTEWERPLTPQERATWVSDTVTSTTYLDNTYPDDADVSALTAQLDKDLTAGGYVYVKPHKRGGKHIDGYFRDRPSS